MLRWRNFKQQSNLECLIIDGWRAGNKHFCSFLMEDFQEEAESLRGVPKRKSPFTILRNYREQQATAKKRGKEQPSTKKRRNRTRRRKESSDEADSTVRQADQQENN